MKYADKGRFLMFFGGAALLLLPLLLFSNDTVLPTADESRVVAWNNLLNSENPYDQIVAKATLTELENRTAGFTQLPGVDFCLHPDTDRAMAEEILRNLPNYEEIVANGKVNYNASTRWSYTATDGSTGIAGDPITLTWGFVPDGTWADGGPSNLDSVFTAVWGHDGWKTKIRNAFDRWSWVIGITYVEVADDGASLPNSPGLLGTRGDVRLSGRSIDGNGNVLAYNYYPNGGDMVLDTDDVYYYNSPANNYATLKNVVAHEHGHGIGLGHVIPEDCTKLMEAYACGPIFVGPQDDDIRGGLRNYGDVYENNDVIGDATDLGALIDTIYADSTAIERGADFDWYLFNASGTITITMDPIGHWYMIGNQYGTAVYSRSDSISDPDFCLYDSGGVLLDSVYAMGFTETEVLADYTLPSSGDYYIRAHRKGGTGNNVQRYKLVIAQSSTSTDVALSDGNVPAAALDFTIAPNPFNPQTTARFFAAAAGSYSVDVYDVSGRLVRQLGGNASNAGWVEVSWNGKTDDGSDVASGVYLMRVNSGDRVDTQRAVLVR